MIEPTEEDKTRIYNEFNTISYDDAVYDFTRLRTIVRNNEFYGLSGTARIGNKSVNYFTQFERLNTRGRFGKYRFSYYYFVMNQDFYLQKRSFKKIVEDERYHINNRYKLLQQLYALYCHQPMIFKPYSAIDVLLMLDKFKILDFTMGWGGRLIGACCCDAESYVGIDMNVNLIKPYTDMCEMVKNNGCNTQIQLFFQDALEVDYSMFDYDIVLTSPPYYNAELYNNCNTYSNKKEWNDNFYKPLIKKTWEHLQPNGYYCLNIPVEVYESVCIGLLGECYKQVEFIKNKRHRGKNKKTEYIYIWYKSDR